MKYIVLLLLSVMVKTLAFAQPKDISVYEKKEGDKNIVMARNTGKAPYQVTVIITSTGMEVTPSNKIQTLVPAGHIKEIATLVPIPGQSWSYSYEVSYLQGAAGIAGPSISPPGEPPVETDGPPPGAAESASGIPVPGVADAGSRNEGIVIFTKVGCGRCTYVTKTLQSKNIAFTDININSDSPSVSEMWQKLHEGGFTGANVTMPVILAGGKYHYNIQSLQKFVEEELLRG